MPDLQQQLHRIEDRQAVADLVYRLAALLDDKAFDDAPNVFADDVAVQTPGGTAMGIEAVVAQARRTHEHIETQHLMTNVVVQTDGDRAQARANLLATFVPDASRPDQHAEHGARYRFEAARTAAGWRLTRIEVKSIWETGDPRRLATAAA